MYLFEFYADEFMLLPAMHYRWSDPRGATEARDAFAAVSGNREAAGRFADAMSGSIQALGVNSETIPSIVAHFDELLALMNPLLADQSFLLGEQMSLADCAMMGPFYAHLYLDLVPGPILRERANAVCHWIERMNHPNPMAFQGFRAGDELHPSLQSILTLIGRDAVPLLLDSVRAVETWADSTGAVADHPAVSWPLPPQMKAAGGRVDADSERKLTMVGG